MATPHKGKMRYMDKQMSLSALSDELSQVRTKKKEFPDQMERIVPWGEWIKLIRSHYYRGERSNKPCDLEQMLRIYPVQNLYDLSDMATVAEVIDSRAFSEFCGVESGNQVAGRRYAGSVPEFAAPQRAAGKRSAAEEGNHSGLYTDRSAVVDKEQGKKRDPEAHPVKKVNRWRFGYKAHIGVDKDSGLLHTGKVTGASIHDVTIVPELLTGDEDSVYCDSGYLGAEKREDAVLFNSKGKRVHYKINRRPSQIKHTDNRSCAQIKRCEREKSSERAKVEHIFAVVKGQHRKTRYRGLRKQIAKLNILFAPVNLIPADRQSCLTA